MGEGGDSLYLFSFIELYRLYILDIYPLISSPFLPFSSSFTPFFPLHLFSPRTIIPLLNPPPTFPHPKTHQNAKTPSSSSSSSKRSVWVYISSNNSRVASSKERGYRIEQSNHLSNAASSYSSSCLINSLLPYLPHSISSSSPYPNITKATTNITNPSIPPTPPPTPAAALGIGVIVGLPPPPVVVSPPPPPVGPAPPPPPPPPVSVGNSLDSVVPVSSAVDVGTGLLLVVIVEFLHPVGSTGTPAPELGSHATSPLLLL
jgi:hypothetical protein